MNNQSHTQILLLCSFSSWYDILKWLPPQKFTCKISFYKLSRQVMVLMFKCTTQDHREMFGSPLNKHTKVAELMQILLSSPPSASGLWKSLHKVHSKGRMEWEGSLRSLRNWELPSFSMSRAIEKWWTRHVIKAWNKEIKVIASIVKRLVGEKISKRSWLYYLFYILYIICFILFVLYQHRMTVYFGPFICCLL